MFSTIAEMLASYPQDSLPFPATKLYNEEWLVKLVLHWLSQHQGQGGKLAFAEGARWYSEAWLPTPFSERPEGLKVNEGWTHADGVVGHFDVGVKGRTDVALRQDATQLVVVEAKMYSPLSPGVTNAKWYDQAARTVACIAQVLTIAKRRAADMDSLGFYIVIPDDHRKPSAFTDALRKDGIREKVKDRVEQYGEHGDELHAWMADDFQKTLDRTKLEVLTWETVIGGIQDLDPKGGDEIWRFYERCRHFSRRA
jgi:hypothetical protein